MYPYAPICTIKHMFPMASVQSPANLEADQHRNLLAAHEAAANKLWRQTVSLLRPLAAAGNVEAVKLLVHALCAAGRPAEASEHLRTAITTATPETAGGWQLVKLLGDCHVQSGQWQQAAAAYQTALAAFNEQQPQQGTPAIVQQRQCQQGSARHEHGSHESSAAQQQEQQQEQQVQEHSLGLVLQACCAAAWYRQGGPHAEAAVHLLHRILQQPQGAKLPCALRLYAQVAADQQQWVPVAQLAVRLLASEPQDEEGARLLAAAAQDSSGLQGIRSAAAADAAMPAPDRAAALAFLASRLQAQGAVPQAVQLYRHSVLLNPASSQCALGLAQALEVQFDYAGVLQALLGYCESTTQQVLGSLSLQAVPALPGLRSLARQPLAPGSRQWYTSMTCSESAAVQGPEAQKCSSNELSHNPGSQGVQQGVEQWHTDEVAGSAGGDSHHAQLRIPPTQMSAAGAQGQQQSQQQEQQARQAGSQLVADQQEQLQARQTGGQVPQIEESAERPQHCLKPQLPVLLQVPLPPSPTQQQPAASATPTQPLVKHVDNSSVDLNALGLLYTAAKALFCGGALPAALELLRLCEGPQLEAAGAQPLHQTSIRNEATYAALMQQLLEQVPPPVLAAPTQLEVLYVVGDSHVLPLAWRTLTLRGKAHVMVPVLLTGCKAWHLRPGSTHPCAYQLKQAVAAVPAGSRVLLVLGELDCREGLLMAVEKLKYNCLQEAVSTTVSHLVAAVLSLIHEHELQVWVHPAPPVLSETQVVVSEFNTELRKQLELKARQHCELAAKLCYVDIESALLQHRPSLHLGGSHLHPSYLSLLQAIEL